MQTSGGALVDRDTHLNGTEGPFQPWEDHFTRLVCVLRDAARHHLVLDGASGTDAVAGMIGRSRWMAAARSHGPLRQCEPPPLWQATDDDTRTKGVRGPYEPQDSDCAALVRVLDAAREHGFTLAENEDAIAGMILRSRWLAAAREGGTL